MTVKDLSANYIIRSLKAEDVPRIFKDWLRSYRGAREWKDVPNPVYYHWHHKGIETLLEDPTVAWLVACDPEHPDMIAGWLCGQQFAGGGFLVHYVYVTQTFRRIGLGTRLLACLGLQPNTGVFVTHLTFPGRVLLESRGCSAALNPYLFTGRLDVPRERDKIRGDIRKAIRASAKATRTGFQIDETAADRIEKEPK